MPASIDRTGQVFGRLTAVERISKPTRYRCVCECGHEVVVKDWHLVCGNSRSCGCLDRETIIARNKARATHGFSRDPSYDFAPNPTYITWLSMRARCENPKAKQYALYGGRGIKICEQWQSFENFLSDMGVRPPGHTIDRKEVNGDYEPGNCRWATPIEQARNRRNNRLIEFNGESLTIAEWAVKLGMSRQALRHRVNAGWSEEQILSLPLNKGNGWEVGTRSK